MNRYLFVIGVLLAGCTTSTSTEPAPSTHTGATTHSGSRISSFASSMESSIERPAVISDPAVEDLESSLHQAKNAYFSVQEILSGYTPELLAPLTPILERVEEDINALSYYVDLAHNEPLLPEDKEVVATLLTNLDEALLIFDDLLSLLSDGGSKQQASGTTLP